MNTKIYLSIQYIIYNMNRTRLEIILGCMFSGKSTELIRRTTRYKAIGKKVLLINHKNDTRTDSSVKTHSNIKENALKVDSLMPIIKKQEFIESDVIGIDEAQFFNDLYDFVVDIEKHNKTIIVAGLDGDFMRKPIGQILFLIPLCDEVTKLTAMDMKDKDGTPAIFSKRIVADDSQVVVGAQDCYMAVSRANYLIN